MSKNNSVPKLNLAPRLKRPLSLLNPLNYVRLLYWSIFFPQAFTWYLKNWAGGDIAPTLINLPQRWRLRFSNLNRRNLLVQELILIFFCAGILSALSANLAMSDGYLIFVFVGSSVFGLLLCSICDIGAGIRGTLAYGVALCLAFGTPFNGIAFGVALCLAFGLYGVVIGLAFGVAYGLSEGVVLGLEYGLAFGVSVGVERSVAYGIALGLAFGITKFVFQGAVDKIVSSITLGVALSMAYVVAEDWILRHGVNIFVTVGTISGVTSSLMAEGVRFGVTFIIVTVSWNLLNYTISLFFNSIKF